MEFQSGNNSKFLSYIVLLIAFFILIFVTKDFFYTLQENLDDKSHYTSKLSDVQEELAELDTLQQNFTSNQDELLARVSKYTVDFTSENVFNYIYAYVDNVNSEGKGSIIMKSLSFSEGTIGDFGLHQ